MTDKLKKTGTLWAVERKAIMDALAKADGHRQRTAEILGIGERTLYRKLIQHGFHYPYARQGRPPKQPKFSLKRLLYAMWRAIIDHAGTCKDEYGIGKD